MSFIGRTPKRRSNDQFSVSLGDCRSGRPARLRCDRRNVFAARVSRGHHAGHGMVGDRRIERDDNRLPCPGIDQHRLGPRFVVTTGSIILAISLALASQTTSLIGFQVIFGLFVGASIAAIFPPMMACVTGWFDTHRSLAVSLVSAGMGMAPMTMSPLAAWLVSIYDWRTSMLIIAAVAAAVMIPVAFLVRRPPALESGGAVATENGVNSAMSVGQALRSPQFIILLLTNFFCCATHSGPIIHTVNYAVSCGIPLIAAVTIYSVEGFAGLGGRLAFGLLGDRF